MSKTLNAHNFLNIYRKILILDFKNIALIQGIQLKKNFWNPTEEEYLKFHLISSHNYFRMMKIEIFLNLILYRTFQNENILPTNMFYDQMDVFIQNL